MPNECSLRPNVKDRQEKRLNACAIAFGDENKNRITDMSNVTGEGLRTVWPMDPVSDSHFDQRVSIVDSDLDSDSGLSMRTQYHDTPHVKDRSTLPPSTRC